MADGRACSWHGGLFVGRWLQQRTSSCTVISPSVDDGTRPCDAAATEYAGKENAGGGVFPLTVRSKKGKGSPYSITERSVPELIPVLGSQPAGDVNHKPDGRLPLLSARPAVTPATLKRAATSFAA